MARLRTGVSIPARPLREVDCDDELFEAVLREAGHDPEAIDWARLEVGGEAVEGAFWTTIWQARSIDLHLGSRHRTDLDSR